MKTTQLRTKQSRATSIAIVGGGPGGLTLARLLQMNGAGVSVYERDINQDARVQGATLDLHEESGLKALREAGLMDAFRANYRPGADKLRVMDRETTLIHDDHVNGGGETLRPEIDRGPLRTILLNSLRPDTVVWDSQFTALSAQNGSWRLDFQNGTSALADVVIAADGANSGIRPFVTSVKPVYSGLTIVEGVIYQSETASPNVHALLKGGKIFALGDEKSLIVSAKGDGSLVFYTGCRTAEHWSRDGGIDFSNKAQVLAWFNQEYAGWSPVWQELFENASGGLVPRSQYWMPLDQPWDARPMLTMLGDAAHLMPPYAGEGVNMAMLDAWQLSNCLLSDEFPDPQSAIAAYEKQMRVTATEAARMTQESTAALHSPDALAYLMAVIS